MECQPNALVIRYLGLVVFSPKRQKAPLAVHHWRLLVETTPAIFPSLRKSNTPDRKTAGEIIYPESGGGGGDGDGGRESK